MLKAFLTECPTCVRCNLDRASMEEILESLKKDQVSVRIHPLNAYALLISGYDYLDAVAAFRNGWITVQDVSSSFVGEAADPRPGDTVLDVCGARAEKAYILRTSWQAQAVSL